MMARNYLRPPRHFVFFVFFFFVFFFFFCFCFFDCSLPSSLFYVQYIPCHHHHHHHHRLLPSYLATYLDTLCTYLLYSTPLYSKCGPYLGTYYPVGAPGPYISFDMLVVSRVYVYLCRVSMAWHIYILVYTVVYLL